MQNLLSFIDFSELDLALWIPSQVFAFLALIAIIYAMAIAKTKTKTLIAMVVFNILIGISVALLSNWQLLGIYSLAVVRDVVFLWREKKYPNNKWLSLTTLFAFLIAATIIATVVTIDWGLTTWELVLAVVIQCAALFLIYGAWEKGVHFIRISRFIFCCLVIVNHIIFSNYMAIFIEGFAAIAIIVFYVRFFVRKGKNRSIE